MPDTPLANLAVRIPRPLDSALGRLVLELREQGIRSSKAELVSALLWERSIVPDIRRLLDEFRTAAPREAPLR
jgi:hypothetical protein